MQAPSNNQTAEPVQNPNSTQRYDSNAIDSEANGAAQSSDSVYESTQLKKKIIQSSQQNRNDSQPDSSESNRNNGSASSNESTKTGHNLKTVGIRIRSTTTKMALWPSARTCSFQVLRQTAKTESGSVLMKTVIYVSESFSEFKARKSAMTDNTVAIMEAAGKFTIFQPNQSSSITESEM